MPKGLALPTIEVVPARAQMGSSLGFHIILACMGIAFPTIVMIVHYRGLAGTTKRRCCLRGGGPE